MVIPRQLREGVFALWVHASEGWSDPFFLNRPQLWWVQGDRGDVATQGGWFRILGTNLSWESLPRARPRVVVSAGAGGPATSLAVIEDDP